ncbi:MAG: 50S ribosomal protein L11 [Candidatus Pacearchaeota archaeon]|nr:50S ribosomal protein L11 [Candidatus Pacearchaeota archaeon]
MIMKLLIDGGDMKPGPAIAQKISPLGMNMGKIIQDINTATKSFKGLKIPVELDINPKSKTYEVKVSSPPVAELLKKELSIDKAAGLHKKLKAGNLAIEQIIKISKTKLPNMLCKDLKSAVKSVIGSCQSLGILVENKEAKEVEQLIDSGVYDQEIKQEKETVTEEKLQELKSYFERLHRTQEDIIKKEEEAKAAEEAAKAVATPAAPTAEAKAGKDAKAEEKKPATEAKKEEKPAKKK